MIIHITKSYDNLKNILTSSKFNLSYSAETFKCKNKIISSAVHPMVSFSQYSEKELSEKDITYGNFGIAFSERWARLNRLSPVIYINKDSVAAEGLATLLKARRNGVITNKRLKLAIIEIKCFTKNETGFNSSLNIQDFNFKNENEWRYIPTKKEIGGGYVSYSKSKYDKYLFAKKISEYSLPFEIYHIETIYVNSESERSEIISAHRLSDNKVKIKKW